MARRKDESNLEMEKKWELEGGALRGDIFRGLLVHSIIPVLRSQSSIRQKSSNHIEKKSDIYI